MYRYRQRRQPEIKGIGFKSWFMDTFQGKGKYTGNPNMNLPCMEWIDASIDFIGKVENMKDDFKYVCEQLEIKANLPKLNSTSTQRLSFDEEMKRIIEQQFKKDLQRYD